MIVIGVASVIIAANINSNPIPVSDAQSQNAAATTVATTTAAPVTTTRATTTTAATTRAITTTAATTTAAPVTTTKATTTRVSSITYVTDKSYAVEYRGFKCQGKYTGYWENDMPAYKKGETGVFHGSFKWDDTITANYVFSGEWSKGKKADMGKSTLNSVTVRFFITVVHGQAAS